MSEPIESEIRKSHATQSFFLHQTEEHRKKYSFYKDFFDRFYCIKCLDSDYPKEKLVLNEGQKNMIKKSSICVHYYEDSSQEVIHYCQFHDCVKIIPVDDSNVRQIVRVSNCGENCPYFTGAIDQLQEGVLLFPDGRNAKISEYKKEMEERN